MEVQKRNLVHECRPEGKEIIIVESFSKFFINGIGISAIHPIPLTEEWLLKFGFVVTETNEGIECFYFGKRYSVFQPANTNVWLLVDGEKGLCEIKHVHQLQNLYFSLTGCELEII